MIKVTLEVEGMRCGMCESHVADQLRKVPGVKKAKADHHKSLATAIAVEGADVDLMKSLIQEQGYIVGKVSVDIYEKKRLFGLRKR